MTNREAYIFGWVYGRFYVELERKNIRRDVGLAASHPYMGLGEITRLAHQERVTNDELELEVANALAQISVTDSILESDSSNILPMEKQSSWFLGYYMGRSRKPLPPAEYDIKAKRQARGMTQAQLAEAVGIDQARISKWESGTVRPSDESIAKLREILD
jgi:DNA-binding XRE family transcriptional regulator